MIVKGVPVRCDPFSHTRQGCITGIGASVPFPQSQWSNPGGYGLIDLCISTTKLKKARIMCVICWLFCTIVRNYNFHNSRTHNSPQNAWIALTFGLDIVEKTRKGLQGISPHLRPPLCIFALEYIMRYTDVSLWSCIYVCICIYLYIYIYIYILALTSRQLTIFHD